MKEKKKNQNETASILMWSRHPNKADVVFARSGSLLFLLRRIKKKIIQNKCELVCFKSAALISSLVNDAVFNLVTISNATSILFCCLVSQMSHSYWI